MLSDALYRFHARTSEYFFLIIISDSSWQTRQQKEGNKFFSGVWVFKRIKPWAKWEVGGVTSNHKTLEIKKQKIKWWKSERQLWMKEGIQKQQAEIDASKDANKNCMTKSFK